MKKEIWKFIIGDEYNKSVRMPKGSEILTVQTQNGNPCIWALVNPDNELEDRYFEIYGTGHKIHCDMGIERNYINTFQLNSCQLVFHVFERIN